MARSCSRGGRDSVDLARPPDAAREDEAEGMWRELIGRLPDGFWKHENGETTVLSIQ